MEKIRLADIAESLGLSVAAVSYVLNGKEGKVSARTRARVLEMVKKSGYLPERAEVLLGRNPSKMIGLIVHDHPEYEGAPLENPYYARFISFLQKEVVKAGCDLLIKTAKGWKEAAEFASMWNMQGLIVAGFCDGDYRSLQDMLHIPMAAMDVSSPAPGISSVCADDFKGGVLAGEYLKAMGHSHVLVLTTNLECNDKNRIDGLRSTGIDTEILMIPPTRNARNELLRNYDFSRTRAVFCVSDRQALELSSLLYQRNLRVPQDVSILGFDGIDAGAYACPPLTTVAQDLEQKAHLAVAALDENPSRKVSDVFLCERKSVAYA